MRISDWSSDVCSSDLGNAARSVAAQRRAGGETAIGLADIVGEFPLVEARRLQQSAIVKALLGQPGGDGAALRVVRGEQRDAVLEGKDRKSTRLNSSH